MARLKCEKHPKYVGKGKPRSFCEACWAIWLGMNKICYNCGCQENGH